MMFKPTSPTIGEQASHRRAIILGASQLLIQVGTIMGVHVAKPPGDKHFQVIHRGYRSGDGHDRVLEDALLRVGEELIPVGDAPSSEPAIGDEAVAVLEAVQARHENDPLIGQGS